MIGGKKHRAVGSRAEVFHGSAKHTSGGLTKGDLMKNKHGRIVSRKKHHTAKKDNRLVKAGYKTKKGHFGFVKDGHHSTRRRRYRGGMNHPSPGQHGSNYSGSSSRSGPGSNVGSGSNNHKAAAVHHNNQSGGNHDGAMAAHHQSNGNGNGNHHAAMAAHHENQSGGRRHKRSKHHRHHRDSRHRRSRRHHRGGMYHHRGGMYHHRGGMSALSPANYSGKGQGLNTPSVDVQFQAGNSG